MTDDLPELNSIRHDNLVQKQVEEHIRQLSAISNKSNDSKIKSLRVGAVDMYVKQHVKWPHEYSNSNNTFIALNLCKKTDSKAHHTKTLFNIHKPEILQGPAWRRKQEEIGNLG